MSRSGSSPNFGHKSRTELQTLLSYSFDADRSGMVPPPRGTPGQPSGRMAGDDRCEGHERSCRGTGSYHPILQAQMVAEVAAPVQKFTAIPGHGQALEGCRIRLRRSTAAGRRLTFRRRISPSLESASMEINRSRAIAPTVFNACLTLASWAAAGGPAPAPDEATRGIDAGA